MANNNSNMVLKLYMSVVEDVINGVRDFFADEGVDDQVLQELRQLWESKIQSSRALDPAQDPDNPHALRSALPKVNMPKKASSSVQDSVQTTNADVSQVFADEKLYPVQITLPAQTNGTDPSPRVLTIQVPESAITGNMLQSVLTGPVIAATLALPTHLASALLQQHVTAALRGQQTGTLLNNRTNVSDPGQVDGAADEDESAAAARVPITWRLGNGRRKERNERRRRLPQLDGEMDSSDDDDDDDDDEDDDVDGEDAEGEADDGTEDTGAEEEPLNSGDDVSEEEVSDLFDTDNVVVCQYDKITRTRNKWKFHLKDGIMNLQGKDYVFQKSNGDAEW